MLIGYARPIEGDLNCIKQKAIFDQFGCEKVYIETHSSPKKREELKKILDQLKNGDRIVVWKLHVLADSTRHLVELLDLLEAKESTLYSSSEEIDTAANALFSFKKIANCLADFQSDSISAKTKAGLTIAKEKGMYAGRPRKPDANVKKAVEMYESKQFSLAEIKEQTGISKSTLYRYLEN